MNTAEYSLLSAVVMDMLDAVYAGHEQYSVSSYVAGIGKSEYTEITICCDAYAYLLRAQVTVNSETITVTDVTVGYYEEGHEPPVIRVYDIYRDGIDDLIDVISTILPCPPQNAKNQPSASAKDQ